MKVGTSSCMGSSHRWALARHLLNLDPVVSGSARLRGLVPLVSGPALSLPCHVGLDPYHITNRNPKYLKKFLPFKDESKGLCLAVRTTYFRCGGLAVGILLSHKIADGVSFLFFVNAWSSVARNVGASLPKFDTATYVPSLDILINLQPTSVLVEEDVAARIFVFSASEISALQKRYTAGGCCPSRVEALLAFIWSLYTGIGSDPGKICVVHNAVNIRSRADPPLSEYQFGNLVVSSRVVAAAGESGAELIRKVREAMKAVDAGYVGRLRKKEMQLELVRGQGGAGKATVDRFFFSSMCKFPLYEADFGWGRPDRVMSGGFPFKNLVTFMDTSGGGIQALIQLTKSDMDKLEAHFMLKSNL
ncbi:shikimate O-hydroxycinnamoyltransferase [Salvia divinorum]|uniref:Shikimate O-hydroxycinnamoyltransferase n=1 Tax=Salvia divinorum TaxID=28513 RepID=A0ABD1HJF7_SALDI